MKKKRFRLPIFGILLCLKEIVTKITVILLKDEKKKKIILKKKLKRNPIKKS